MPQFKSYGQSKLTSKFVQLAYLITLMIEFKIKSSRINELGMNIICLTAQIVFTMLYMMSGLHLQCAFHTFKFVNYFYPSNVLIENIALL